MGGQNPQVSKQEMSGEKKRPAGSGWHGFRLTVDETAISLVSESIVESLLVHKTSDLVNQSCFCNLRGATLFATSR